MRMNGTKHFFVCLFGKYTPKYTSCFAFFRKLVVVDIFIGTISYRAYFYIVLIESKYVVLTIYSMCFF